MSNEIFAYDYINSTMFQNTVVNYGIMIGDTNYVLIKTGRGGSLRGYEDRYIRLAKWINSEYGFSVVCSDNPASLEPNTIKDMLRSLPDDFSSSRETTLLFYVGISDGARMGIQEGSRYPQIQRMLLINCPLMINWTKTKEGIERFRGERATFIYGQDDPSVRFLPFIEKLADNRIKVRVIEGEDHNFSNGTIDLKKLVKDNLLFDCNAQKTDLVVKKEEIRRCRNLLRKWGYSYPRYKWAYDLDEFLSDIQYTVSFVEKIVKGETQLPSTFSSTQETMMVVVPHGKEFSANATAFRERWKKISETNAEVFRWTRGSYFGTRVNYYVYMNGKSGYVVCVTNASQIPWYIHPITKEELQELMEAALSMKEWGEKYANDEFCDGYSFSLHCNWEKYEIEVWVYACEPPHFRDRVYTLQKVFEKWWNKHDPDNYDQTSKWERITN